MNLYTIYFIMIFTFLASYNPKYSIHKVFSSIEMGDSIYVSSIAELPSDYLILDSYLDNVFKLDKNNHHIKMVIRGGKGPGEIEDSQLLYAHNQHIYILSSNGKINQYQTDLTPINHFFTMRNVFPTTSISTIDSLIFFSGRSRNNQLFSSINANSNQIKDYSSLSKLYNEKKLNFIKYSLLSSNTHFVYIIESINTGLFRYDIVNDQIEKIDHLSFINTSDTYPSISNHDYKNIPKRELLLKKFEIVSCLKVVDNYVFISTFNSLGTDKRNFYIYLYDFTNKILVNKFEIDGPVIGESERGVFYKHEKNKSYDIFKISI